MFDRWGEDPRDYTDDTRDHEREGGHPHLGRGPGDSDKTHQDGHGHEDERWPDRGRDPREQDAREVFTKTLHLPRGPERARVADARERTYTLRGSESRSLATIGAFRVVSARDLRDDRDRASGSRDDLRHLREQGLVRTIEVDGRRDVAVVLTDRGRDLLEANRDRERDRGDEPRQEFYSGLKRERELEHDVQVFEAYLSIAERLLERDLAIERVVLDYELKREYQEWLHERDRDGDGRPNRDEQEIEAWAHDHELPFFDDHVHFPDLRIEYELPDGRRGHEDVEVVTLHYRGAHGAAAARSGFTCHRGTSARIGGGGRANRKGGGRHGGLAEEMLR